MSHECSTAEGIRKAYEDRMAGQIGIVPEGDRQFDLLLGHLPADRECAILDAGCGNGAYASSLHARGYVNIDAVDLFDSVDIPGVKYRRADITAIPAADGQYDFVYSNSVLYYLRDLDKGVRELSRVLKPGAALQFSVYTRWSPFTVLRMVQRKVAPGSIPHLKDAVFHPVRTYLRAFERAGFSLEYRDGFGFSFMYPRIRAKLLDSAGIRLPAFSFAPTANAAAARFKSYFAYHAVFGMRKRRDVH